MTKTKVFIISVTGITLSFIAQYFYSWYWKLGFSQDIYRGTYKSIFLLSVAILMVWFFIAFLREEVFRAWLHFAYWWLPLSLVMVYLAAGTSGGGFGIPNVFDQETVAFIFSGLFLIISLLLIAIKSFLLRRK